MSTAPKASPPKAQMTTGAPAKAAKMTPRQVYELAMQGGFDPVQARIMTAIAWAESGLNPTVLGDLNIQTAEWGPSVGLWQIRTLKAETGKGTHRDIVRLRGSVLWQAQSAYAIYHGAASYAKAHPGSSAAQHGGGYSPWTSWWNGTKPARQYLPAVEKAAGGSDKDADTGGVSPVEAATGAVGGALYGAGSAIGGAITSVPEFLAKLADPHTWVRVVQVVGGLGCLVVGALLLRGDLTSSTVGALTNTSKGAAAGAAATGAARAVIPAAAAV